MVEGATDGEAGPAAVVAPADLEELDEVELLAADGPTVGAVPPEIAIVALADAGGMLAVADIGDRAMEA